jgi:ribosomal protein L9
MDANIGIFGSVSTYDIATKIRTILARDTTGSRIVLGPEDITFAVESEESDRVKNLGTYEVHIKVKGADEAVRRTITVNAQE